MTVVNAQNEKFAREKFRAEILEMLLNTGQIARDESTEKRFS